MRPFSRTYAFSATFKTRYMSCPEINKVTPACLRCRKELQNLCTSLWLKPMKGSPIMRGDGAAT